MKDKLKDKMTDEVLGELLTWTTLDKSTQVRWIRNEEVEDLADRIVSDVLKLKGLK